MKRNETGKSELYLERLTLLRLPFAQPLKPCLHVKTRKSTQCFSLQNPERTRTKGGDPLFVATLDFSADKAATGASLPTRVRRKHAYHGLWRHG